MTVLTENEQPTHLDYFLKIQTISLKKKWMFFMPILNIYPPVCCFWRAIIEANSKNQCNVYDTCRAMWRSEKDDWKASSDSLRYIRRAAPFFVLELIYLHRNPRKLNVWRLLTNKKLFKEDWKLNQQNLSYVRWSNCMQSFYPRTKNCRWASKLIILEAVQIITCSNKLIPS